MGSAWKALPLLVAVGALAWGCSTRDADEATAYTSCRGEGEACADGTECLTLVCCFGSQCTQRCVEDDDCPRLPGYQPVCETFNHGRYCAIGCAGEDAPCPDPFSCTSLDRLDGTSVHLCL